MSGWINLGAVIGTAATFAQYGRQSPHPEPEKPRIVKGPPIDPKDFPSPEVIGFWKKLQNLFFKG